MPPTDESVPAADANVEVSQAAALLKTEALQRAIANSAITPDRDHSPPGTEDRVTSGFALRGG
jgi:hypothetical protein